MIHPEIKIATRRNLSSELLMFEGSLTNKSDKQDMRNIASNTSRNETIKDDISFVLNEDAFGVPSNEPYLFLRSAYLDHRFNPPRTWILAVAAKTLDRNTAQCVYKEENGDIETVKAVASHDGAANYCFYAQYIFYCNLGDRNPDFVTLTFNDKGKFLCLFISN